jgi:hypothetical protein
MGLTRAQAKKLGLSWPCGAKGRPAHTPGQMNRLESRFACILEARRLTGEIRAWHFERDTLALGPEMTFQPDFVVEMPDGTLEYYDVKGFVRDDATVKIKAAAVLYPQHRFYQAKWRGGLWRTRLFRAR